MKLLLVRHGQTQFNAEHRYLGALDPLLNDIGIRQAQDLADSLPHNFDQIICSPLLRAKQTAEIIGRSIGKKPICVAAFRERNVGVFEGLTQNEAREQFPALWLRNITRQWHEAPPDGETIAEVFARAKSGLDQLILKHPRETVLLVAHGFIAKVLRSIVLEQTTDFFDWQLGNGASVELIVQLRTRYTFPQSGSFY